MYDDKLMIFGDSIFMSDIYFLFCFLSLKESTFETRKNYFYFSSKALFVLEIFKV